MSHEIDAILEQALKDSAAEAKRCTKDRDARYAAVLDWARWQVAVNGGRWIDYANPFEARLADAWKI